MSGFVVLLNQYGGYFLILLFVLNIATAVWVFTLRKNIKNIFRGERGDLEKVLLELRSNQDLSAQVLEEFKKRIGELETSLPKDLRRVGLVRYNPFSDAGGDQSFVLALLNDYKDGVVITSLFGREINRIYAKPVLKGASTYQLTKEEKTAIENAK